MGTKSCKLAGACLLALSLCVAAADPPCDAGKPDDGAQTVASKFARASCAARAGQRAQAILLLQQVLAEDQKHQPAKELLLRLLPAFGAEGPAFDFPSGADLRAGREWWRMPAGTRLGGWLAFEAGYDSNINAGTDQASINIPLLRNRSVPLDRLLVEIASPFAGMNGGVALRQELSPDLQAYVRGLGAMRLNAYEIGILPYSFQFAAGAAWRVSPVTFLLEAATTERRVAAYRLHNRDAVFAEVSTLLRGALRAAVSFETADNLYPLFENLRTNDHAAALVLRHLPSGLRLRLVRGEERSETATKDLDRDFAGYSATWETPLGDKGRFSLAFGHTRHHYLQTSLLFLVRRLDKWSDFSMAYEHSLGDGWFVAPRLVYERNASNIPLTRFERRQLLVEARKEF